MPSLRHSLAFLTDYRLGYSPQRPYPWRWTTPLALFILLTSTALLTCLNIPLSAYEITQEFTYFPNATVAPLPMSNMIPSFLRDQTTTFAPQTLHVGDTFRLNNSIFSYTIISASDAVDRTPVSSFSYYNNPLSNSCDVTNLTATITRTLGASSTLFQYYDYTVSGFVTCTEPTLFQMTWGLPTMRDGLFVPLMDDVAQDLKMALYSEVLGVNAVPYGDATVKVTVRPCCNCTGAIGTTSDATNEADSANLLEPPCSTEPARFIGLSGTARNTTAKFVPWGFDFTWNGTNTTDLFAGMDPTYRQGYVGSRDLSALDTPFQNLFQVLYHLIYSSPDMVNRSITAVAVPQDVFNDSGAPFGPITESTVNTMRAATSNETLMAQWRDSVLAFNETDRVPVLEYLRPIPRRKPLGSAITSVFVSTFAMVSAVWTIFSIAARAFVRSPREASDSATSRERLNASFYEAKRSLEEVEATEACSLTTAYKDPTSTDDRLNILFEQVAILRKRTDGIENNLRDVKRGAV
ncbi:hypothetical protein B0H19DRAFT_1275804 [Mycena capillaripes]|nr:hypothetical protein B0H19DRAFT_1275804 [Mycena capillaripes]